uniref:Uncharacterized protein n=1 Tax=Panagrolaimus davidi TaxID=227884 RepID=A0A914QEZ6_9BILA
MQRRVPFAVLLANGDKDATASPGDAPVAIPKIRQYVSQKLLILVDKEASDSYLRLLKTRHFVVGGFATYFSAKQSFVIFEHASNAGALCIGLRAPQ